MVRGKIVPEPRSDEEQKMILKKAPLYETSDLKMEKACRKMGIFDITHYLWKKHRKLELET